MVAYFDIHGLKPHYTSQIDSWIVAWGWEIHPKEPTLHHGKPHGILSKTLEQNKSLPMGTKPMLIKQNE